MPKEKFSKPNISLIEKDKALMNDFQSKHYNARAETYDIVNEKPSRAEKLKTADEYFIGKLEKILQSGEIIYLDYGCGTFTHTKQFLSGLKNNPVKEGYGIDIAEKMLQIAVQTFPKFNVIKGGAEKINFENKFDLITSFFYVLGNLTKDEIELFFWNVYRALKPGGILCFDVLKSGLSTKAEKIIKRQDKYFIHDTKLPDNTTVLKDEKGNPILGAIREFSAKEIIDLAKKNNFEIVDLALQEYYPEYTVILRKKNIS